MRAFAERNIQRKSPQDFGLQRFEKSQKLVVDSSQNGRIMRASVQQRPSGKAATQ